MTAPSIVWVGIEKTLKHVTKSMCEGPKKKLTNESEKELSGYCKTPEASKERDFCLKVEKECFGKRTEKLGEQ